MSFTPLKYSDYIVGGRYGFIYRGEEYLYECIQVSPVMLIRINNKGEHKWGSYFLNDFPDNLVQKMTVIKKEHFCH